ncbi:MAG: sigma-54 interaction domain-containing protein [bacterium]
MSHFLQTEEALRESEERYRQLVEQAGDAIFVSDELGRIIDANQLACESLGYARAELLQMFIWQLNPQRWTPETVGKVMQQLAPGNAHTFESFHLRKDGSRLPVEIRVGKFRAGGRWLYLDIARDVTERKRAEAALQAANEKLEQRVAERTAELQEALVQLEQLKNRLQAENVYFQEEIKLEHNFEEIITQSELMRKELRKLEQVATTDATVLILGETGTGKELIARAVHNLSPRQVRPLVKVNCAALPAALIESELFGHEKGAFTGALSRKAGRFELADGGTIFLDEIADMPWDLQAKLLRVLQEGEFERVGGQHTLQVNVRVIAATNADLAATMRQGKFREDLFYRLNVFPLEIPPLRRRPEDIPLLCAHFVRKYGAKLGKQIDTIPQDALAALQSYTWPGNIRELENVIARAIVLTSGGILEIPDSLKNSHQPSSLLSASSKLEEVERNHIIRVLQEMHWKVSGKNSASERLGLNASTLRSRMQKLSIKRH